LFPATLLTIVHCNVRPFLRRPKAADVRGRERVVIAVVTRQVSGFDISRRCAEAGKSQAVGVKHLGVII